MLFMSSGLLLFTCNPQPSETEVNSEEEPVQQADAMGEEIDAVSNEMTEKMNAEAAENYYIDPQGNIVYTFLEEENMPTFAEGSLQEYLSENLIYPQESRENESEGTVVVSFIVAMNGDIHAAEVVKPTNDELLNTEAIRVIENMPAWNPGIKDGKNVPYKYHLPISFKLKE